jgi:signal transduction histidine kinase
MKMRSLVEIETEVLLKNLVHDLRQPLSTIETSTYYLNLLLGQEHPRAHEQLRTIEQQVDRTAALLTQAVNQLRRLQTECRTTPARSLKTEETSVVACAAASPLS